MSTRKAPPAEEARYSAPALEKGLDILELLAAEPHGLSLQEVARRLERSPNELFRMLDVMVRRGYIARQPDASYMLTLRLFELAHLHPPVDRLLDCAMPHMQELARATSHSNHLCVHHDERLVVLARAESPEPMSYSVRAGSHFPFHDDRVSARIITAFQTGSKREQYFRELLGEKRPPQARVRDLDRRLEDIRRRGYDEGPSDTISGVTDICFPIFDHFGVVASLNVVYMRHRDTRVSIPQAREKLRHATGEISRALGWMGPRHEAGGGRRTAPEARNGG
ncbi:MAG TPA: IclR family transcriptional regulator [Burkholderiales bacterium]|nr:IclR family transcriptional regulator [Burkholderiales bacterium]